jgi:GNAT superfamily N-acetyltransferase
MAECKIVVEDEPQTDLCEAIDALLRDYNWTKVDRPVTERFAVSLRHPESNAVIGGIWGSSAGGWLFIEALFVPDVLRKCGTGTLLVRQAEEVATKRGCVGIWLDTFTFQAPTFYEKLGYQTMGKLADFPKGHDRIFYFKRIDT